MPVTAKQLIDELRETQLGDIEGITWSTPSLLRALNAALRMLVVMRPDVSSVSATVALIAGTRQNIPADGLRLLKVIRNIKSDGVTAGQTVRLVQMEELDLIPNWHQAIGSVVVHYCYDPRVPREFYVYPPVPAGQFIDIDYSQELTEVTVATLENALPVDVTYIQPLQELMLFKLFSGDSQQDRDGNMHFQAALGMLGIKAKSEQEDSPASKASVK